MKQLSDSELEVMLEIWKADKPLCRFDLEELLKDKKWASTTILTILSRIELKKYVKVEKKGRVKYYTPIIKESEYAALESKSVLNRFFGNSLKNFVACMTSQEEFSDEELEELQLFLDEQKRKEE